MLKACYDAISQITRSPIPAALTSSQPLTGASSSRVVSPSYFQTLRIALKRGRFFTDADHHRAVINQAMAHRDFPTEDPIGRTLTLEGERLEIVGVVADTRSHLFEKEGAIIYRSSNDAPAGQIAIRTTVDPLSLAQAVRKAVAAQGGTVAEISTMESFVKNDSWQQEQAATLTTLFAALAFLLATVGLYGVISFAVARRRKEIGIRVALGATQKRRNRPGPARKPDARKHRPRIRPGVTLLSPKSVPKKPLLRSSLSRPRSVLTAVASAIALATLTASYIPTRRALKVDPAKTLHEE